MADNGVINSTMTVREVITRYPEAQMVFNKHGLTGCGGPKGPMEPISFFATVHNVDAEALLQELNEVARAGASRTGATPQGGGPQTEVYRAFVKTAIIVALTAGCTLGAVNLAYMALAGSVGTTWGAITQAHGHAQIFGWVGLFIMGVAYHVLPRLKATELQSKTLAQASFWLVLVGLVLRTVSQPWASIYPFGELVVLSAILEVVGASFFVYVTLRTLGSSAQPRDFYDKYILASAGWFLVLAAATLGIAVYAATRSLDVIPGDLENPYLHIALYGFVGMMIFGISLRTIPLFLGLRSPNKKAFTWVFWALNAGIVAKVATSGLAAYGVQSAGQLVPLASLLEYAAIIAFIYFLNIFRKPEVNIAETGADRGYEKFIRAAYLWLAVAATMTFWYAIYEVVVGQEIDHAFVGAYRHALTVGFISMMIMGMASRVIPVFSGVRLHSSQILLVSFVLINVGNVLRVASQPLAHFFGGVFLATMGVSGFIEVTALALFAYNIWKTMGKTEVEEENNVPEPKRITKGMVVADVLERYPQTLGVFVENGFSQLRNPVAREVLAKTVTIEQAANIQKIDLDALLTHLNAIADVVASHHGAAAQIRDGLPIVANHIVGEIVEQHPETLDVFVRYGFEHLKDETLRTTVAKTVTVEMACRIHSINVDEFLADLNNACKN
ncbi:MAG: DUF1858 domain-containing protein [Chloroflexi bacterium]|nr:DUF1858 domain-containing protein [Chloroflexota bacterium]